MHTTTQLAAEVMRTGAPSARVAHAALFERVITRIHRYFTKMVWDPNDAEECVQRTLVEVEKSLDSRQYDPDRSFNTWLWLKARTVYAQWCRERERLPETRGEPDATTANPDPTHTTADRLDAVTVLTRMREELGDEVYEAFVLYYEGGLTMEEVASALDRDRKTIRKRIDAAHALADRLLKSSP